MDSQSRQKQVNPIQGQIIPTEHMQAIEKEILRSQNKINYMKKVLNQIY